MRAEHPLAPLAYKGIYLKPIVIELKQDALKSDISVTDLLRKAYVVARKLKLSDFEKWIKLELDGYLDNENIPEYRNVYGSVEAWNPYHGWQPIYFEDHEMAEAISNRTNGQRVAEIESLLKNNFENGNSLQMPFSAEQENIICDAIGENMTFSDDEKDKVESHSYNVNNFYGEVTGSQIQQSSPDANQTQTLKGFSTTNVNHFISSLKESLDEIKVSEDSMSELNAEIATIEIQNSSPKPKEGIIKESLNSIRTILEGATGSVAGQLLLELGKLI